MEEAALRIAHPEWSFLPTDAITILVQYDEGYSYSEYTFSPASVEIVVLVSRSDGSSMQSNHFRDEEAEDFWKKLMQAGDT